MSEHSGQKFHHLRHIGDQATYSELNFEDCEFLDCTLMQTVDPTYPIQVRDVSVTGGRLISSHAIGVKFENVTITDCPVYGNAVTLAGCVFRNVVMRGRLGAWILNDMHKEIAQSLREQFLDSEREFYSSTTVSLDISEAVFESLDAFYFPGNLVRRDPETQFLVRKSALLDVDLSVLPKSMRRLLQRVERNPFDSTILVVGREVEDFSERIEAHRQLVKLGIAE